MSEDPFAFSDSIRDIDEKAPFIRLKYLELMHHKVALLLIDMHTRRESIYAGYVQSSDYYSFELETLDHQQVSIGLINADFYPFVQSDAAASLKAITNEEYTFGMRFVTPELYGYLLAEPPPA